MYLAGIPFIVQNYKFLNCRDSANKNPENKKENHTT
jgi:hypothetical protein